MPSSEGTNNSQDGLSSQANFISLSDGREPQEMCQTSSSGSMSNDDMRLRIAQLEWAIKEHKRRNGIPR
jgi:hypothetical protein